MTNGTMLKQLNDVIITHIHKRPVIKLFLTINMILNRANLQKLQVIRPTYKTYKSHKVKLLLIKLQQLPFIKD